MDYHLERFVKSQYETYDRAFYEIKRGWKVMHWMWYIFPQLRELAKSRMAEFYGIENMEEAKQYLAHHVLGKRLRECCESLLALDTNDPCKVLGRTDDVKLRYSMTLFAEAEGEGSVFEKVIDKFYQGEKDRKTIELLKRQSV